jgi:hypothetical protein
VRAHRNTKEGAVPGTDLVTPNLYQLSGTAGGHAIQITYSTTGFDGKPHFSYQDGAQGLSFAGSDIRLIDADVGHLVSVTIRRTVDTGSTSFSLLLPRVMLPPGPNQSTPVDTQGITTIHRFSVLPSFNLGQDDFYSVVALSGTARFAVF